jgi:hypothetical protein
MKATMRLTPDGLTRALRQRMHRMADEIETGYLHERRQRGDDPREPRKTGADDDDVSGD